MRDSSNTARTIEDEKTAQPFQADRRTAERSEATDRRRFLRPTKELQRKGFLIAALGFILVLAVLYIVFE